MRVWILWKEYGDEPAEYIVGVFSTEELAQRHGATLAPTQNSRVSYFESEWIVDEFCVPVTEEKSHEDVPVCGGPRGAAGE